MLQSWVILLYTCTLNDTNSDVDRKEVGIKCILPLQITLKSSVEKIRTLCHLFCIFRSHLLWCYLFWLSERWLATNTMATHHIHSGSAWPWPTNHHRKGRHPNGPRKRGRSNQRKRQNETTIYRMLATKLCQLSQQRWRGQHPNPRCPCLRKRERNRLFHWRHRPIPQRHRPIPRFTQQPRPNP